MPKQGSYIEYKAHIRGGVWTERGTNIMMRIQTRPLSIFLSPVGCWLGSAPGCSKLFTKDETGNQKIVSSMAFKFEKLMHLFLCCGLGPFVWMNIQIKVQTGCQHHLLETTHEILARMPLNSFSWSICWAFGAKCSWQNFVMVCLSWEKTRGETHTLHLIDISPSSSLASARRHQDPKMRKELMFQVTGGKTTWKTL